MKNFFFPIGLFLKFIKNPYSSINKTVPSVKYFDGILLIFLPLVILENILLYLIGSDLNKMKLSFEFDNYFFFLHIIFLAPIFEEMIFRYCLNGNRRNILFSSISSFLYVVLRSKFFTNDFLYVDYILIIISLILLSLYLLNPLLRKNLLRTLFYSLTFVFAALHIFNYKISIDYLPIIFISVLTYSILGFAFAFYRLKHSFIKALKFHIIYNLLTVSGLIITHLAK